MLFISKSVKETQALAVKIIKKLARTNIICLYGELGTGKTTFVQGLAKYLGIKKRITSPTFIIVREYPITYHPSIHYPLSIIHYPLLYHVDLYRLNSDKEIQTLDLETIWSDPQNLVVIEWAEKIKKLLPKKRIEIKFKYINENKRKIIIDG